MIIGFWDIPEGGEFWTDEDVTNVYIELLSNNVWSDKYSGKEDNSGLVDNLSGRQLQADAEAVFIAVKDLEKIISMKTMIFPSVPLHWNWVKHGDLHVTGDMFPEADYFKYRNMTPVELFEQTIIDLLAKEPK
ncbi:hypothetical protein ILUMI_14498 [Ignelater luminosus]|uniref:Uncharacterized protein n=1 Tax=Ignelater luminosus TaxID=2038154 RepID=A0A8K0G4T0_IGNLU|nr:hypothetical protein ILUMI_14498 [Ignelater luminosus]